MKKIIVIALILTQNLSFCLAADDFFLAELLKKGKFYQDREVQVEAEVLDVFSQSQGAWVNVVESGQGLGIWVKKEVALPDIKYTGSYNQKGDVLRVKGYFNTACPVHFGQSDIHAKEIVIVKRGRNIKDEVSAQKRKITLLWFLFFLVTFLIYLVKRIFYAGKVKKN